jgi:hypothetical protein
MTDRSLPSMPPTELGFEVLKLLLQVVWADDEVVSQEAEAVLGFARTLGLTEDQLRDVNAYLKGEIPLPAPNLGVLRPQRAEVVKVVKKLLEVDSHVSKEEEELLVQIWSLLK